MSGKRRVNWLKVKQGQQFTWRGTTYVSQQVEFYSNGDAKIVGLKSNSGQVAIVLNSQALPSTISAPSGFHEAAVPA